MMKINLLMTIDGGGRRRYTPTHWHQIFM